MSKITVSRKFFVCVLVAGLTAVGAFELTLLFPPAVIASPKNLAISHAQQLNREGIRQWETGQTEAALQTWQQAEVAYATIFNRSY